MSGRKRKLEILDAAGLVRRWREKKGWSRKRAAEELGVNWRTWESWEQRRRTPPSLKLLEAMAAKPRGE